MPESDPPVFVFVPGSWHRSTCYDKVTDLLRTQHGLTSYAVTLPSTSGDRNASFKDDIDAARAVIINQIERGHDVIVVAHSYGGMVGNSAIKGLARKSSPRDRPKLSSTKNHVIGLVLITSGFTLTGVAFMDPFLGRPPPSWRKNTDTGFAELVTPPSQLFYHDLPRDEAEWYVEQLTPQSLKSLFEGGEHAYAGWQDVPSWYISAAEDRAMPNAVQRMQVGMARGQGADVTHRELPTSHSPFLSRAEDVVRILVDALQDFRSGRAQGRSGLERRRALLMGFWPQQWLRFGFWMGFGEIIGRGLVGFRWMRGFWRR